MPVTNERQARRLSYILFRMFPEPLSERDQLRAILQGIQKAFRNSRQTDLGADKCSGENGARLILAAAVQRMKYRPFEIVVESGRKIISSWKLMINRAGHPVDDRYFPCRLDPDARIEHGLCHVGWRKQGVRGRKPSSKRRIRIARLWRLQGLSRDRMEWKFAGLR